MAHSYPMLVTWSYDHGDENIAEVEFDLSEFFKSEKIEE